MQLKRFTMKRHNRNGKTRVEKRRRSGRRKKTRRRKRRKTGRKRRQKRRPMKRLLQMCEGDTMTMPLLQLEILQ